MGFSLNFMRIGPDAILDADRDGLAAWLAGRELEVAPSTDETHHLRGADGQLRFDGHWTDLHLDPLDREEPVTGGIWSATLSAEECAFVYDLCVAGRMLIMNPQGGPLLLVPGRTHEAADLPESIAASDIAWVDSADELAEALGGGFQRFVEFRDQVTGDASDPV